MANPIIGLGSRFDLEFTVAKTSFDKFSKLMELNNFTFEEKPQFMKLCYVVVMRNMNLRKAELVRQLLKNITVYD